MPVFLENFLGELFPLLILALRLGSVKKLRLWQPREFGRLGIWTAASPPLKKACEPDPSAAIVEDYKEN
jgi:hypothetical protein